MTRVTGTVKFFNDDKGYGFIVPDNSSKDIFVHRSSLVDGLDKLNQDQRVSYVEANSNRKKGDGKMATDVKVEL